MPKQQLPLLVVEDDQALAQLIIDELETQGWNVVVQNDLAGARYWLETACPAIIITDLRLPDGNGMELVKLIVNRFSEEQRPGMIVITAFGSVRQAVEALQLGADDFLTKPLDLDHFLLSVKKVMDTRRLKDELFRFRQLSKSKGFHGIIGQSRAMRSLFDQIRIIARAHGPVLITGESGTGKELVAKALHAESDRSSGPFLAVNCAGVPQELLESEFFGHAAGAFTGANKARKGLLQEAHGGSLLLDEIGEMPLSLQAKLLRALQDGSIRPVGQDTEEQVDVRIIAATHRDLRQKIEEGCFREDLYYRLETFTLSVPPLREREEDRELLAQRFLRQMSTSQGKYVSGFTEPALSRIKHYAFPGNVRELQNVIERAVAFCAEDKIRLEHLPSRLTDAYIAQETESVSHKNVDESKLLAGPMLPTLDELQKRYVRMILQEVDGNKRRAAALLGIGRRTLYRWIDDN